MIRDGNCADAGGQGIGNKVGKKMKTMYVVKTLLIAAVAAFYLAVAAVRIGDR